VPWAILTSSLEWFVLVPLFPFFQPIFTLQQPYWIGFLVHLSSASIYPLFAWLRRSPSERRGFEGRTFLRIWRFAAIGGYCCLGPLRCLPPTSANRRGSVEIRPSTRASSGICLSTTSREFCWLRWLPGESATPIFAPSRSLWWRAKGGRPGFFQIGGRAGSWNR
jgi:hypothetical protein